MTGDLPIGQVKRLRTDPDSITANPKPTYEASPTQLIHGGVNGTQRRKSSFK